MRPNAEQVVRNDLDYICGNLQEEFGQLSGKALLLTGGAGFLGYYLVQSVLHWNKVQGQSQSIQLTVFDNYMRGVPEWLLRFQDDRNLTLVRHDMINPLPNDMADYQYIIHAAGIASPIYYRQHPIETMDANIHGLRELLDYARRQTSKEKAVLGFLYYSSSEIYGDPTPENIPTPETYRGNVSCTGPRACYDESKRYGETLCVNFARQYDLPIKVVRPFNNYGPGLKITDRRVVPDFAKDVLSGRDIVMLSDGAPKRTFCYIADAIVGYYKILVKGLKGESYNIGVEEPEISIAELAERIVSIARDIYNYDGKVIRQDSGDKEYLVDNPNRRCPQIKKARTELGYNPAISLEEGLRRTLIWYYDNRVAEEA
jgi:nucleoside-diphosphate-sugar epimerase